MLINTPCYYGVDKSEEELAKLTDATESGTGDARFARGTISAYSFYAQPMSNASMQVLETLKREIGRDEDQIKGKERELVRMEDKIKEKERELERMKGDAATLQSAIGQIKAKRESIAREVEAMQRELQQMLKKTVR